MAFTWTVVLLCSMFVSVCDGESHYQPEQIHIAYGLKPTEMVVTWTTLSHTTYSVVEYGPSAEEFRMFTAKGSMYLFTDGGSQKRKLYMHKVTLIDLYPGKKYYYHCGGPVGWSGVYHFYAMRDDANWSPRLAIYGDMGNDNAQSLARLQEEVQSNMYDAILHVGDFAYDMATDNGRVGDAFMRQIETVAAYVPYMTVVGNHEYRYNFSNYVNRFNMPGGDGHSIFYSFNMGPAHIIGFSTELYFFYCQYGIKQLLNQYRWLEQDLKEANLPENRAKRPWIITMAHRPMYCTNHNHDDCTHGESTVRTGLIEAYGLEELFFRYGVDIEFWAHEHSYERLWPVYNRTVCNGTDAPYTNPPAPVHIITGSGGCDEQHSRFGPVAPWTANRTVDYGYTRMNIINNTHLYMEQVSDDKDGEIVDRVMVIKDTHGPYKECKGHYWTYEEYAKATKDVKQRPTIKHGERGTTGTESNKLFKVLTSKNEGSDL